MILHNNFSALDIALANFLSERSGFSGEEQKQFSSIILSLSSQQAEGHSCIQLTDESSTLLSKCRLVHVVTGSIDSSACPLVIEDNRLYLNRYWRYESRLVSSIVHRLDQRIVTDQNSMLLDKYFPLNNESRDTDWQREAAKSASQQNFTIITGGPGTGKTTTVLKILALLQESNNGELSISLAAPTGKAAMRLQQSLIEGKKALPLNNPILLDSIPDTVSTLHRLLGPINQSNQFKHTSAKPLSCDLLVIDESSMIDLAMMSKLLDALHPTARLILLGDKDQLASVESGAVLNDLCSNLLEQTVELKKTWRFSGPIKALAQSINTGDAINAWELLVNASVDDGHVGEDTEISLLNETWLEQIHQQYQPYINLIKSSNDPKAAMTAFSRFQVLAAVRQGEFGVDGINRALEKRLYSTKMQTHLSWYHGKPIMITRNDPSLGLYNGDIGICLSDEDSSQLKVWFIDSHGGFRALMPSRLPQHETVFAMTIHKSQGSEFDHVMIVLPDKTVPILSRELLYTGVTRAKKHVGVAASESVFKYTVNQQVVRNSGIPHKIKAAVIDN